MVSSIFTSAAGLFAAVSVVYLVTWYDSADLVKALNPPLDKCIVCDIVSVYTDILIRRGCRDAHDCLCTSR